MFARHRQPTGPMWPYIGLLGLLFALSITAPRAWTRKPLHVAKPVPLPTRRMAPVAAAAVSFAAERPALARPLQPSPLPAAPLPRRRLPAGPVALARPTALAVAPVTLQESTYDAPTVESVFRLLAPSRPVEPIVMAVAPPALEPVVSEPSVGAAAQPAPLDRLALVPAGVADAPEMATPTEAPSVEAPPAVEEVDWLAPTALLEQLEALVGDCESGAWAMATIDDVRAFVRVNPRDLDVAGPALQELWRRRYEGDALAEAATRPALATQVRRACDALERRLKVWDAALDRLETARSNTTATDASNLGPAIDAAERLLASREDEQGWREYLLLDEVRAMNDARASVSDAARAAVAGRVFERLASPDVAADERRLFGDPRMQQLADALNAWTDADEAHLALARQVERFEGTLAPSEAQLLAAQWRRLASADDATDRELATLLNQRFRNANVRLEFTADLISRLLPESEPREQEVAETILGVANRGHSRTTTRLFFRTGEDRRRLHLELLADGDIDSWTTASSGPARFQNEGRANFSARRRLRLDRRGLHAEAAQIEVASDTQLLSLRTDYDDLPLVGRLVRRIARDQYHEKRGAAEREAERRIEEKVRTELMGETDRALAAANIRWRNGVMTPLDRLGVSPQVIEAGSNPRSATLRVRLAADSQLGAHTPRPRLPQDALLSMQIHQSAMNNMLEGLDLNGRSFNLVELGAWISQKLNRDDLLPRNSLRDDVWVHFADKDAISTRLVNDQIELNITFAELITTHRSWHNFAVRVRYRPRADDLQADLMREGPVELVGDSVRGVEMVLRGIVSRMFPDDAPWELIPQRLAQNPRLQGLQVTHFVIDDGWLSVAVGEGGRGARSQVERSQEPGVRR